MNFNEKWCGEYPNVYALRESRIEVIKLFIDYVNKNNIILKLNEYSQNAILNTMNNNNNNIEMIQLIN